MNRTELASVWPPTAGVAREAGHQQISPLEAIRLKCLDCSCYQPSEIRLCEAVTCPLWPFRAGKHPYTKARLQEADFGATCAGVIHLAQGARSEKSAPRRPLLPGTDQPWARLQSWAQSLLKGSPKVGRPSHKPDPALRRQVEAMAGYGVAEVDIARVIGIDAKTLRKPYRDELDLGHVKANAKVAENLFRKATGEGRDEHGGPEGGPLVIVTGVPRGDDARELSYPEPRKTAPLSLTPPRGDRD
jgi:hypothetical protein